jgi:hypothetical protein
MNKLIEIEAEGKKLSPVLPSHVKNYLIDIDGNDLRRYSE